MKKILSVLLIAVLLISFCACAKKQDRPSQEEKITIVSTVFPPYDYIRAITKDVEGIENIMLLAPGNESHSYEPSVSDIAQIKNADLFLYIGGESDEWVDGVLETTGSENAIALKTLVKTLEENDEGILTEEEEETAAVEGKKEAEEPEIDEHIWTSLRNSQLLVKKLCEKLCELKPENATDFKLNAEDYCKKLKDLDADFANFFSTVKNKTIVIADRNPFRYFAEDYSLKLIAAFEGCSSNSEISLGVQNELVKAVIKNKLSTVFVLENNNGIYADAICKQTGAKKAVLNSCHNVSADIFEKGTTYYELMVQNLETLKQNMK